MLDNDKISVHDTRAISSSNFVDTFVQSIWNFCRTKWSFVSLIESGLSSCSVEALEGPIDQNDLIINQG